MTDGADGGLEAFGVLARLLSRVPDRSLRSMYRVHFWRSVRFRRNPIVARVYALKCAVHYHMHRLTRTLEARDRPLVNSF